MAIMDSITLENFRCFRQQQTVKLAPLTLLVGENSTGKTSFLSVFPILTDLANGPLETPNPEYSAPNFRQEPYDLGSFREIAHTRDGRRGHTESFMIGFDSADIGRSFPYDKVSSYRTRCTFRRQGVVPALMHRYARLIDAWVEEEVSVKGDYTATVGTPNGRWKLDLGGGSQRSEEIGSYWHYMSYAHDDLWAGRDVPHFVPLSDSPPLSRSDASALGAIDEFQLDEALPRPFAGAPISSRPHRTYDPAGFSYDSRGEYMPMYLADLSFRDEEAWRFLKNSIEEFGRKSGLFDEIRVRQLRAGAGDPFQLQVRKGGRKLKGPHRNLIDVGYGVSQALPLLTELLRPNGARQFLLQQPEVHLHPSAQAALGSLFCEVATNDRQLIVETHSDHLIDRVRMEVRDGTTALKPEDVMILYFERNELDIKIHEIRFDELGNVCGAPGSYGDFMMQETRRSLGL